MATRAEKLRRARTARLNPYQRRPDGSVGRGRDHWAMVTRRAGAGWEDYVRHLLGRRRRNLPPGFVPARALELAMQPAIGPVVHAYVNGNRWGASCECGGFDVVDPDDPRFYCVNCYNVIADGRARLVAFPKDRQQVERVMRARPDPLTRSSRPGESVKLLMAENLEHGASAEAEGEP